APFSWTSTQGLTISAIGSIVVNKPVSDAGPAPLTLTYNANGSGGMLSFGDKGRISFLSTGNALTINGQGYILANSIQSLAQLIARNPSGRFALSTNYNAKQDGAYAQSPISTPFDGSLEGLGNTISRLRLIGDTSESGTGLFSLIEQPAFISNLRLDNVEF